MAQNIDFTKLTKVQLQDQLRARGLKVGGNKPDLIARLNAAVMGGAPPAAAPVPAAVPGGLPVAAPAPKKPAAPKKNPLDMLQSAVRGANQTLGMALTAVLNVYGAGDMYGQMMEIVGDRSEAMPAPLAVPETYEGLKALKMDELRGILKNMNQKVGGKKEELIQRILNPAAPAPAAAPGVPAAPPAGGLQLPPVPGLGDVGGVPLPTVPGVPAVATSPTAAPTLPTVATPVPELPTPALPTVPGLPTVGSPTTSPAALPTVTSPNAVPAIPTVPGLPTVGSPTTSPMEGGIALPTIGSPDI